MNRREFIKYAAVTAGALALPVGIATIPHEKVSLLELFHPEWAEKAIPDSRLPREDRVDHHEYVWEGDVCVDKVLRWSCRRIYREKDNKIVYTITTPFEVPLKHDWDNVLVRGTVIPIEPGIDYRVARKTLLEVLDEHMVAVKKSA